MAKELEALEKIQSLINDYAEAYKNNEQPKCSDLGIEITGILKSLIKNNYD